MYTCNENRNNSSKNSFDNPDIPVQDVSDLEVWAPISYLTLIGGEQSKS